VEKVITKEMSITDVVEQYPATTEVFMNYGMHCFG
jgi:hybrid cluster-associated redox disulfide protein